MLATPCTTAVKTNLVHAPSSPLLDVVRTCTRIAGSDATVLITGETGTGKEVFARLIHENSQRAGRALVPLNCGAIPEALLESELFGYVRGAFTGAISSRRGRIALAEGGTLFLDEIGEMPLALQVKLLRLLQEKTYEPVGSSESISGNFRLVAATNRDLAEEVAAGRFRQDLYYRLLVCPVELPPLRARRCDVLPLFLHFWQSRGETRPIDPSVFEVLENWSWPGNVRELENLAERLSVCSDSPVIGLADLPAGLGGLERSSRPTSRAPVQVVPHLPVEHPHSAPAPEAAELRSPVAASLPGIEPALPELGDAFDLPELLRTIENRYIDAALLRSGGNKKAAADMLGLQRTTLVEKLRRRKGTPCDLASHS